MILIKKAIQNEELFISNNVFFQEKLIHFS